MQKNIVEKFKKYARELGQLYKTRKELDHIIREYESKLRTLGEILEFADSAESTYRTEVPTVN